MTNEHEQRLIRIVSYYTSRGRTEERDDLALECLYELISDIEASTNNCPNSCCYPCYPELERKLP